MVRLVTVVVPQNRADEVLDYLYTGPKASIIYQITSFDTLRHTHVTFKTRPKHLQEVVSALSDDTGCGIQYGAIDVMALVTTRPTLQIQDARKATGKKKMYRISDRMSIDEISSIIDDGNHLTFDFMALVATASVIAGAGLLADSATTVIASMLVSPLMGPILSLTFGVAIGDVAIMKRGLRNEMAGIAISLVVGIIMGIGAACVYPPDFRSNEMQQRGTLSALAFGFLVAAPSGMGVVLGVSMGGVNAIVGTAISAALLPPIVNAGMSAAMGIFYYLDPGKYFQDADDLFTTGMMSLALFSINFVVIVLVGFITFRYVKDIRPVKKDDDPNNIVDRDSCRISRLESGFGSTSNVAGLPLQQPLIPAGVSNTPGIMWTGKMVNNTTNNSYNNANDSSGVISPIPQASRSAQDNSPLTGTATSGTGNADMAERDSMPEADDDASLDDHSALREYRARTRGKSGLSFSSHHSDEGGSRQSSTDAATPIEPSAPTRNSFKNLHRASATSGSTRNAVISRRSLWGDQSSASAGTNSHNTRSGSEQNAQVVAALSSVAEGSEAKQ